MEGTPSRFAATDLMASISRDSSPPEAILLSGCSSSPRLGAIRHAAVSLPSADGAQGLSDTLNRVPPIFRSCSCVSISCSNLFASACRDAVSAAAAR